MGESRAALGGSGFQPRDVHVVVKDGDILGM